MIMSVGNKRTQSREITVQNALSQRKNPTDQIQVDIKDSFRIETQLTFDPAQRKFEKKPVKYHINY